MRKSLWLLLLGLVLSAASCVGDQPRMARGQEKNADIEARLRELGIELSPPGSDRPNRVPAVRSGNLVFIGGHGPRARDGTSITGKVVSEVSIERGYEAARLTAINLLSALKHEVGNLNRVNRIVRVFGMVNADPDFIQTSKVIDGCSDLLVEVFGENGKHARAAVGMATLPLGWTVEIEMIVELRE